MSDEEKSAEVSPAQEFADAVAKAMAGDPLVMCLVAIGRDGRSHCLTSFPGASSIDLFELAGRLQSLVNDVSTVAAEIEDEIAAHAKAAS